MNICVFTWMSIFILLGEYVEVDCRSYGKCIFNFMRNWQRVLQSGCTILHSYQLCMRVLVASHLCPHLVLPIQKNSSHYGGYRVVAHCGFICISLMIDDVERFFPPCAYLPLVYLFRWSVCSHLLPISKIRLSYYCFVNSLQILINLVPSYSCFLVDSLEFSTYATT